MGGAPTPLTIYLQGIQRNSLPSVTQIVVQVVVVDLYPGGS
jgi:hypothetical protein